MIRRIVLILFVLISTALKISAQKINTDRPDQAEAPYIIPKNSFQIESGLLTGRTDNNNTTENNF